MGESLLVNAQDGIRIRGLISQIVDLSRIVDSVKFESLGALDELRVMR